MSESAQNAISRGVPLAIPVGATAQRPSWSALPDFVRDGLDSALGDEVVEADSQASGFTPGFASRLGLADGRRVFAKAADRSIDWLASAYGREAEVLAVLPSAVPAPRVRQRLELTDGSASWLVLVIDDVAGRPPVRPWRLDEARRALAATDALANALDPAPNGLAWGRFVDDVLSGPTLEQTTDPRLGNHLAELHALLQLAGSALDGTALVHSDLRDDNVLLAPDRVWFCDWNWPVRGAPWLDSACLALSMVGDGLDPAELFACCPVLAAAEPEALDALLVMLLAYFSDSGSRPPAEGSPYIRSHQRWYAEVITGWLCRRRGWAV